MSTPAKSTNNTHTHTRLTALCPGLPRWAGTRKVKPIWILLEQETVSGSGISWAIFKSAPRSRQITMPAPHHSVFTGWMPFLLPNQQCQSTKGNFIQLNAIYTMVVFTAILQLSWVSQLPLHCQAWLEYSFMRSRMSLLALIKRLAHWTWQEHQQLTNIHVKTTELKNGNTTIKTVVALKTLPMFTLHNDYELNPRPSSHKSNALTITTRPHWQRV